jgi:hypothetical protein
MLQVFKCQFKPHSINLSFKAKFSSLAQVYYIVGQLFTYHETAVCSVDK